MQISGRVLHHLFSDRLFCNDFPLQVLFSFFVPCELVEAVLLELQNQVRKVFKLPEV
jgi:hypothetical protein